MIHEHETTTDTDVDDLQWNLILLVTAGNSGSIKYEQICDSTIKMCYVSEFIISENFSSKICALHVALFYEEVARLCD